MATPDYSRIPAVTLLGLRAYCKGRREPGGFLRAVLENDLVQAFQRADDENLEALFDIVSYLYNEVPSVCWGSPARVRAWLYPACRHDGCDQEATRLGGWLFCHDHRPSDEAKPAAV